jgi:ferredoxin-type protein NapH
VFVILLPMFLVNEFGMSPPYFCEYICPVGTLEGGIPLVLLNKSLRSTIGFLFAWRFGILIFIIVMSMLVYRPFCRYLCPLGAFYSLFNKISFLKINVDKTKCTNCLNCVKKCKMNIDVRNNPNSAECIRCGACAKACHAKAIKMTVKSVKTNIRDKKAENVAADKIEM